MPIERNGNIVDEVVLNGSIINEVTVDGAAVYTSSTPLRVDDFSSDTLDEYTPLVSHSRDPSQDKQWQIAGGVLKGTTSNSDEYLSYDISNEYAKTGFVDASVDIAQIRDNDVVAIVLSDAGQNNVYMVYVSDNYLDGDEGLAEWNWGSTSASRLDGWNKSLSSTDNLRITYNGTTLNGYYNNQSTPEVSATVSFTPASAGIGQIGMSPETDFDNFILRYESDLPVAYESLIGWYPFDATIYGGSNDDDVTAIIPGSGDSTAYDGNAQSITYKSSGGGNDGEAGDSSGYYDFTSDSSVIRIDGQVLNGLTDYTISILAENAQDGDYFLSMANSANDNEVIFDGGGLGSGWNHVAITRNNNATNAYINGNSDSRFLYNNRFGSNPLDVAASGFVLGQEQDNVGGGFNPGQNHEGGLDDLRVYNRALSPSEINDIVSNTLP